MVETKYFVGDRSFKSIEEAEAYEQDLREKEEAQQKIKAEMKGREVHIRDLVKEVQEEIKSFVKDYGTVPSVYYDNDNFIVGISGQNKNDFEKQLKSILRRVDMFPNRLFD